MSQLKKQMHVCLAVKAIKVSCPHCTATRKIRYHHQTHSTLHSPNQFPPPCHRSRLEQPRPHLVDWEAHRMVWATLRTIKVQEYHHEDSTHSSQALVQRREMVWSHLTTRWLCMLSGGSSSPMSCSLAAGVHNPPF